MKRRIIFAAGCLMLLCGCGETAAPEESVTSEATSAETQEHICDHAEFVPLYQRESYTKGYDRTSYGVAYHDEYNSIAEFDIEDEQLRYLTENAHFIRCELFEEDVFAWNEDDSFTPQTAGSSLQSTNICFESFAEYAKTVFTEEYFRKMSEVGERHYNNIFIPYLKNIDDEVYTSAEEGDFAFTYSNTVYRIYEQTEDKVTVVRETVHYDMDHSEDDPDYCEPHSYLYIDLVNTPEGWRFDYFPMYDECTDDVDENGDWFCPEYHQ